MVLRQFPRRRRIMVCLEYFPYYLKLFSHIWQLYTLGVGKFFHMFKFDLSSLSRSHDQKIVFSGTPARHRSSGNQLTAEACNFIHVFILSKTRAY